MYCLWKEKRVLYVAAVVYFFVNVINAADYDDGGLETRTVLESETSENISCYKVDTHDSDSDFPEDLFTKKQRLQGAIILHIILATYCFVVITVVCTEHFLPTIKCICEDLKLSDDVAAATFMSIATSSPELFTNIIGTFVTESDIGVGHVIGNAYYDMFFVASLGGLAATGEIILDWWPLARDCFIYLIVAITLAATSWDGEIETYETIILLSIYVVYFIVMFNNRRIIAFLNSKFNIDIQDPVEDSIKSGNKKEEKPQPTVNKEDEEAEIPLGKPIKAEEPKVSAMTKFCGVLNTLRKWSVKPLVLLTSYSIPDVRKNEYRKYYPLAFVLCIAWIGIATYLCCWMISVIGNTLGVPDYLMGMIFMAAGGSVVEAYAVYYKARRGECSIGLSNSMGCNTLDATMCLAFPWLIKTLIPIAKTACNSGSSNVVLESSVLHVNCILLVISVILLFTILYLNKFRLDKILGGICGFVYIAIIATAICFEIYGTN